MTKYQEMLEEVGIIPEDIFNDIINSLPAYNLYFKDIELYEITSIDDLCTCCINEILYDYLYAYADNVDFDNKTFELCDVNSLNDLIEIKNKFSKWTISNYDEMAKDVQESSPEKDYDKKNKLFNEYVDDVSYEDLEKFLTQYDKK